MEAPQLTRDEIIKFDLWKSFWIFLCSFQRSFRENLETKIGSSKLCTSLISENDFFDRHGNVLVGKSPKFEEISFWLPNRKTSLRICIPQGIAGSAYILLIEDTGMSYSSQNKVYPGTETIEFILSPKVADAAKEWIENGLLTDFAKEFFMQN